MFHFFDSESNVSLAKILHRVTTKWNGDFSPVAKLTLDVCIKRMHMHLSSKFVEETRIRNPNWICLVREVLLALEALCTKIWWDIITEHLQHTVWIEDGSDLISVKTLHMFTLQPFNKFYVFTKRRQDMDTKNDSWFESFFLFFCIFVLSYFGEYLSCVL